MAQPDEPLPTVVSSRPLPARICDVVRSDRPRSCCGMAMAGFRTAKYQLPEWHRRNAGVYYTALTASAEAERGRAESKQLVKHAAASAQRAQEYSKSTLGQRLGDIQFWRMELQKEIMELDAETNLLAAQKLRLERALDATEVPYAVVIDNLECRERRQPPDLVIDEVETQLLKVSRAWSAQPWHCCCVVTALPLLLCGDSPGTAALSVTSLALLPRHCCCIGDTPGTALLLVTALGLLPCQ